MHCHTLESHPLPLAAARTWGARSVRALSQGGTRTAAVALLAVVGWLAPTWSAAAPLWVWKDDAGRPVYSDLPPPAQVPNARIVRQPGPAGASPAAAEPDRPAPPVAAVPTPAATGAPTAVPKPGPADAAAAAEDKRKAEEAQRATARRNADIRADNCKRAQASRATLQTGGRLATVDEQGRRVIMDEAMRNAEQSRLDQIIADNCR